MWQGQDDNCVLTFFLLDCYLFAVFGRVSVFIRRFGCLKLDLVIVTLCENMQFDDVSVYSMCLFGIFFLNINFIRNMFVRMHICI